MGGVLTQLNQTTTILLVLAIILLSGFLMTRLTKLAKLPNVTGYILAGILIGPHVLALVSKEMVASMGFVSDIALAFIAFSVGRYLKKEAFEGAGFSIITITIFESLIAGILITVSMFFIFKLSLSLSLMLGAIATATAPASTMVTIRQYNAKGKFVNTLLQVVVFDDAVCLIVFSLVAAIINAMSSEGTFSVLDIMLPLIYNFAGIIMGFLSGYLLSKLLTPSRSEDNRLILTIALLLGISGICAALDISPLLSCMVFGITYVNLTQDTVLYKKLDRFTPPIYSLFFVVSGMSLDITAFATLGVIGIAYFAIRIVGKYVGAYTGCTITRSTPEEKKYLGFALVPQAGVAIGLAFLGQRILPPELGDMLLTIILASSVLYELIGPASAKFALFRSGAIKKEVPKEDEVETSKNQ